MKKLLLILLCLPMIGFGQQTYVPDANFEQALINLGYDTILDGTVTTANINTVNSLNVTGQNISDLTGIEDFSALTTLYCSANQITNVDISQNISLTTLSFRSNQLTSLDVSQNTALTTLYCYSNQLTSIDLSSNIALEYLDCEGNQLTSLDVSQNTALTNLLCYDNQLTTLDLSQNTALTNLLCYNNQLTSLDLSNNLVLSVLSSYNNPYLFCIEASIGLGLSSNQFILNIDSWTTIAANCNSIYGCTDSLACNYNSLANTNNGFCILPDGCTDATACNYDATATCDDGSCIGVSGCTDATSYNYNSSATCDDGSCAFIPQGINYQAVARDVTGDILMNQVLDVKLSIISDITTGNVSWQETHQVTTNAYGLFTAIIGGGVTTGSGSSSTFYEVDWGASNHLLKVEVDYGSGLVDMGTTAFMSVPYSIYSANPGPQGLQGIAGNDGQDGVDGVDGADGATGPQGPAGNDGVDGQGGITNAGTGISVTGAGTSASPYVVSTTPSTVTYSIGDTAQGGIVFYVSPDGKNGLVAATVDQSTSSNWYNASDVISSPLNHTSEGQKFLDWRLPTKYELNQMYLNIGQGNTGNNGGFSVFYYWSSTAKGTSKAWIQSFINGNQYDDYKDNNRNVRAVRAF